MKENVSGCFFSEHSVYLDFTTRSIILQMREKLEIGR